MASGAVEPNTVKNLLKTAVSRTHLDVLQRDISIDIGNPMDVGLRHLTRLQKMGDTSNLMPE
ncbi:hypothetical protein DAPPUDRAFT_250950 [Daphnia pulex]|uniref:Uncharacterized protein n=1 Tax=Daphnia pulex TaxID=6669 RepID=E9GZH6_DAPPU|nr:hypothetical protein DAPPUDRAFT_250950 [Daphnia pulex]|eukprot:EFX75154.1 hypothetical protein DAPPUDRAFT_250950 [Daphnia pulex]